VTDVAVIGVGLHRFGRFEGKSAMQMGADGIRLGDYDIGIVIGLDKHPRGAFTEDPALVGMPRWYAENGQYLTTQFFGMKANRYLHDHGISHQTPARVAAKNFRNGALNPNALRRKLISEKDILASPMLNYPLTQYMFCAPDEGAYEVNTTFAPVDEDLAPTVYAARAAFEKAGVAPTALDVIQLQDTDAGAEIIRQVDQRRPVPARGFRQRHRRCPHGAQTLPQVLVEAGLLGGAHRFDRTVRREEVTVDGLQRLVIRRQAVVEPAQFVTVHAQRSSWPP